MSAPNQQRQPEDDQRTQYPHSPESNVVDRMGSFLHAIGGVTRPSPIREEHKPTEQERSLAERTERARLYHLLRRTPDRAKRWSIVHEAHQRDALTEQYLRQGSVHVDLPGLGEQSAQYAVLEPPDDAPDAMRGRPPIVLIPGISNDLGSVETLMRELALSGRRVITIAYPDSWMGEVSEEFATASEKTDTYAPHVQFFREALRQLAPAGDVELWGYSTGGPILAEMLTTCPEVSQSVPQAVIINPVAAVAQPEPKPSKWYMGGKLADTLRDPLMRGAIKDTLAVALHPRSIGMTTFMVGRDASLVGDKGQAEHERRLRVTNSLIRRVRTPSPHWGTARVRDGGKIIVVSSVSDDETKCHQFFSEETAPPNPQMTVVDVPGRHLTPLLEPSIAVQAAERVMHETESEHA